MADRILRKLNSLSRQRIGRGRSPAYVWLRACHADLAAAFVRSRPPWSEIAAAMSKEGITGGRGKPLTANAAMRIWGRVCRDVAAENARTPLRPVVKTAPVAPANGHSVRLASAHPATGPPSAHITGRDQLDDLAAALRNRSK
jgi:hypothetical protein